MDIAGFSAIPIEEEVLLLPGLPLINELGENLESDLWSFEVGTPAPPKVFTEGHSTSPRIDYVHPGASPVVDTKQ